MTKESRKESANAAHNRANRPKDCSSHQTTKGALQTTPETALMHPRNDQAEAGQCASNLTYRPRDARCRLISRIRTLDGPVFVIGEHIVDTFFLCVFGLMEDIDDFCQHSRK